MASSLNKDEKGILFDIQRFCIHDGPGIRTTVFMKGCPLRCLWCSNPESQSLVPNLMVRDIQCRGCGACMEACPEGAISLNGENKRIIGWDRCTQCLQCAAACIYDSLNICGRYASRTEILEEVLRDIDFYRNSGGGVTVSGGEPLCQAGFVTELLKACQSEGLHTALDTTGCVPWGEMEKALEHVDLILFDVKHMDPGVHKKATGVGNELILENLARAGKKKRTWLRVPLIEDFNDSDENIEMTVRYGQNAGVEKISLLPYHEGGKSKCAQMGKEYLFSEGRAPEPDRIEQIKRDIEKMGLKVTVGS